MKTNVTLSVDIEVLEEFKKIAAKRRMILSRFLNDKMKKFIKEEKKNE